MAGELLRNADNIQGAPETFRQPLYDRVNLPTSLTGDISFFTQPIGASVTLIRYQTAGANTKTYRDTNLTSAGVDTNRDFAIYGISMALIPESHVVTGAQAVNIRKDKDVVKEGGSILIKTSASKEIIRIPLIMIPELNGEIGGSTTATSASVWGGSNNASKSYPLTDRTTKNPFMLPRNTSISVTMTFDGTLTLGQTFDCLVIFDASIQRNS